MRACVLPLHDCGECVQCSEYEVAMVAMLHASTIVCVQEAILGRWTPGRRTWFSGNPELMMERRGIQTAETRAKIHEAKWSDQFFDIKR